jgi:hypothetical protein
MRRTVLIGLLLFAACSSEDPVKKTIADVTDAAEDRDLDAVMKYLSADFTSNGGGRAEAEAALKQYFFGYRTIDITVTDLETEHSGSSGAATFRVNFIGVPKTIGGLDQILPRSAVYRFDTQLAQRDGAWRITSAEWEKEK